MADQFDFVTLFDLHREMKVLANRVKRLNNEHPMGRRGREYMFHVEDSLDGGIDTMFDFIATHYGDETGFRQWGMQEGWVEPETVGEEQWYVEHIGPLPLEPEEDTNFDGESYPLEPSDEG
jgi:hypothetical protein